MKLLGMISVDFNVICQLLIIHSAFVRYYKKWKYNRTLYLVDFRKTCNSVRREVLYNIVTEFGIPIELVGLIKMCLNETHSKVCIGKHLCDAVHIQNGLKQGDAEPP
jgi:hypothetical protein